MNPKINIKINLVKKFESKGILKFDFEKPKIDEKKYSFSTTTSMN